MVEHDHETFHDDETFKVLGFSGAPSARAKVCLHDFPAMRRHTWRATARGHVYRNTSIRVKGRRYPMTVRVYLHRQIMGLARSDRRVVDHLDNDPLNNCRRNLEVVTKAENNRRGGEPHGANVEPDPEDIEAMADQSERDLFFAAAGFGGDD